MPNYVIINGTTVIDANTDHFGRNFNVLGTLSVGSTTINQASVGANIMSTNQFYAGTGTFYNQVLVGNSSVYVNITPTGISSVGNLTVGPTTINGSVTVTSGVTAGYLSVTQPAGTEIDLVLQQGGTTRFYYGVGGDGNTFFIATSNNTGGFSGIPLSINRTSGLVSLSQRPTWQGGLTPYDTGNFNPATKADLTGATFSGDLTTYRAGATSTGALYMNSAKTAYVFYDGSTFSISGGNVNAPNGDIFARGQQLATLNNNPYFSNGIIVNGTIEARTSLNLNVVANNAVDNRRWDFAVDTNSGTLYGRTVNDAYSVAPAWLTVTRAGTTSTSVSLSGTNINLNGTTAIGNVLNVNNPNINIQADANRSLSFKTAGGVARASFVHDNTNNLLSFNLYDTSGAYVRNLVLNQNGEGAWGGNWTVNGNLTVASNITTPTINTTSNGNGNNIRIGDDVMIGDVNLTNGFRITGISNADRAYIGFGTGGASLGFDSANWTLGGGGSFTYAGAIQAATFKAGNSGLTLGNGNPNLYTDDSKNMVFRVYDGSAFHYPNITGSGRLVIEGIQSSGSLVVSSGDIHTNRGNTATGYIFFGNTDNAYFGYDGTKTVLNGGDLFFATSAARLYTNGDMDMPWYGGRLSLALSRKLDVLSTARVDLAGTIGATSYLDIVNPGIWRSRFIVDGNANLIVQNGGNSDNQFYITNNGVLWSKQMGIVSDYINSISNTNAANAAAGRLQRYTYEQWSASNQPVLNATCYNTGMSTPDGNYGAIRIFDSSAGATNGGAAFMSFHRYNFASYFGLETDNTWRVGGWSMGAASYRIFHQGIINPVADVRMTFAGNLDYTWNVNQNNYAEPYQGGVMTSIVFQGTADGSDTRRVGGARWRYVQKQDSYGNWYTVGYV